MTTRRDELKGYFANGQLPTGENFAELIDSMVHQDEFAEHEASFRQWTTRGEISLGAGEGSWRLFVDDAHRLHVEPGQVVEAEPGAEYVELAGWAGMRGRIGTCDGEKAFVEQTPELDLRALPSVKSDGNWQRIVDVPRRSCAFEVTAGVVRTDEHGGPPGETHVWRRLLGYPAPENAVVHAVATANGSSGRPTLACSGQPDTGLGWRRLRERLVWLLVPVVVAALLIESPLAKQLGIAAQGDAGQTAGGTWGDWIASDLGMENVLSSIAGHPQIWGVVLAVALLYVLRLLLVAFRTRRNGIELRWIKASGSVLAGTAAYALHVRGPAYGEADARVHYHITKLWS